MAAALKTDDETPDAPREADSETAETADEPDDNEGGGKSKARKRRFRLFLFFGLLLLIAAAGGAYYWFVYASRFVSTDDAFIDGLMVRLSPQISGKLVSVSVENNAHVAAGDLLAKIDPAEPMAQLALKTAQLAQARAGLGEAKAKLGQARSMVEQQKSSLEEKQTIAENAQKTADRFQALVKKSGNQAISPQQVDNTLAQARQAVANVGQAKAQVASANTGVTSAQAHVAAAQAQVEAAQADVANARVTVSYLEIRAPISGYAVQKTVNVGTYVQPGSQLLAIVPDDLYVTANFKETQLAGIEVGAPADLAVDAYPDTTFKGHVVSIQRGAGQAFQVLPPQNATGNFVKVVQRVPVRISIDEYDQSKHPLGPGMSVVPSVHIQN